MRQRRSISPIPVVLLVIGTAALGCQRPTETAGETPAAHAEPAPAGHDTQTHEAAASDARPAVPTGEPRNPVQAEMRLLLEATRDWVTAIAQHDLASIPPGISRVHAARLVTEEALKAGTYAPPKGGAAALDAFVRKDEAFHDELVALLQAAKANDLPAATRQLGVVLDGCTSCHMTFRY